VSRFRDELRSTLVGALVFVFFALLIMDALKPEPSIPEVQVCIEPTDEQLESLYHNEDSYPVTTRM
jgi:hypothetical protein